MKTGRRSRATLTSLKITLVTSSHRGDWRIKVGLVKWQCVQHVSYAFLIAVTIYLLIWHHWACVTISIHQSPGSMKAIDYRYGKCSNRLIIYLRAHTSAFWTSCAAPCHRSHGNLLQMGCSQSSAGLSGKNKHVWHYYVIKPTCCAGCVFHFQITKLQTLQYCSPQNSSYLKMQHLSNKPLTARPLQPIMTVLQHVFAELCLEVFFGRIQVLTSRPGERNNSSCFQKP